MVKINLEEGNQDSNYSNTALSAFEGGDLVLVMEVMDSKSPPFDHMPDYNILALLNTAENAQAVLLSFPI